MEGHHLQSTKRNYKRCAFRRHHHHRRHCHCFSRHHYHHSGQQRHGVEPHIPPPRRQEAARPRYRLHNIRHQGAAASRRVPVLCEKRHTSHVTRHTSQSTSCVALLVNRSSAALRATATTRPCARRPTHTALLLQLHLVFNFATFVVTRMKCLLRFIGQRVKSHVNCHTSHITRHTSRLGTTT
jgi:hypothetical protein